MNDYRGLRHYLQEKRRAMDSAAAAHPAAQDWRETVSASCVADDATGVRKVRMRDWQLIGDSGPAFGGWGLGPSSPELLCGVISTCLTHTYLIGAAAMDVPVDRVEIEVSADNNDAGFLDFESDDPATPYNIVAHVRLDAADATEEQRDVLHRYARERCPLTALVRQPNDVRIEVVSG